MAKRVRRFIPLRDRRNWTRVLLNRILGVVACGLLLLGCVSTVMLLGVPR